MQKKQHKYEMHELMKHVVIRFWGHLFELRKKNNVKNNPIH